MVAANAANSVDDIFKPPSKRWPLFLGVSIFFNGLLVAAINLDDIDMVELPPTELHISLSALAAPSGAVTTQEKLKKVKQKELVQAEANTEEADVLVSEKKPVPREKIAKKVVAKPTKKKPVKKTVKGTSRPVSNKGKARSTVVHKAKYRRRVPPVYPPSAVKKRQQGLVVLLARVNPNGRPGSIRIARSSGYSILDRAALKAVRKWEFVPQRVNGRASASWVRVPVRFAIRN